MFVLPTDVRAKGKGASAKTPNACDDVRMDPKGLPEHLQPLMEWISEDITTREREELAAAIYQYQDVFSSGPEDVGQTDLVTHTIDTGNPIRFPPRRLPITTQDVEKAEGVIEPCQSSWHGSMTPRSSSPVVLVTKEDGCTRFCVDYRKVTKPHIKKLIRYHG